MNTLKSEPSYVRDEKTKELKMVDPNPFLQIGQNKVEICAQDGRYYRGTGGEEMEYSEIPQWFWNIARTSYPQEHLDKFKVVLPENRVKTEEEIYQEKVARHKEPWTCEICHKVLTYGESNQHKAVHAATKTREEIKARKEEKNVERKNHHARK